MSPVRLAVMAVVAAALVGLMGWQYSRINRIEACLGEGKIWNGPLSRCEAPRSGPLLQRDLKRT